MLATIQLREMNIEELQSLCHGIVVEMLRRVEEEQESKAEVNKAYDELAEVADIRETQVKVLREGCQEARNILATYREETTGRKSALDAILGALERADALEEE